MSNERDEIEFDRESHTNISNSSFDGKYLQGMGKNLREGWPHLNNGQPFSSQISVSAILYLMLQIAVTIS